METLIVGDRGQVTIPKKIRDRFGIKPKSPVIIEVNEQGIIIRPTVIVPIREFSDDLVKQVEEETTLKKGEKKKIQQRWQINSK
jgi:AbrB family looped-hinge helix DNA binding protein